MGGVEVVKVNLTLSNLGGEDATGLFLHVEHSSNLVFTDNVKIEIDVCEIDTHSGFIYQSTCTGYGVGV